MLMSGDELREARLRGGWTQQQAAGKLGVTQAYLSMVEHGHRVLPSSLARKAVGMLHASPTALPLREEGVGAEGDSDTQRAQLAALGYPGFGHVRGRVRRNPAEVLLNVLHKSEVDTRVVEGLPWLALTYAELDWDWAVRNAKLHDLQNRLGFVTTMASRLEGPQSETSRNVTVPARTVPTTSTSTGEPRSRRLKEYAAVLDRSRLVKE